MNAVVASTSVPFFAVLDDARAARAWWFSDWQGTHRLRASEPAQLDEVLRQGWAKAQHALVLADYEFGAQMLGVKAAAPGWLAIHWFATRRCLEGDQAVAGCLNDLEEAFAAPDCPCGFTRWQAELTEADYVHKVQALQEAIARGESYQINFTFRQSAQAYGSPLTLYRRLRARQSVPYGAVAHLPQEDGARWLLSLSPELFLRLETDGTVSTEPMKGTAPIVGDGRDDERARALHEDAKNRAENIMIVDLLRNDLGKIARVGGVSVPALFEVNAFGKVWQMTSRIQAQLQEGIGAADIVRATFPCGSITGAPKRAAMQLIGATETSPRGLYTGTLGFLEPPSAGGSVSGCLNVLIRTLELYPTPEHPHRFDARLGVGSGIVADSDPAAEFEECAWKSAFTRGLAHDFALIETLRVDNGRCELLQAHRERMAASAQELGFDWDEAEFARVAAAALAEAAAGVWRLRLILDDNGLRAECTPLAPLPAGQKVALHPQRLPMRDFLRRHKVSARAFYDNVWQTAAAQGAFDGVVLNEAGQVLEGGRSSIFIRLDGQWHTPPLTLDILPGVMRAQILRHPERYLGAGGVNESVFTTQELDAAEKIILVNALRGVVAVDRLR